MGPGKRNIIIFIEPKCILNSYAHTVFNCEILKHNMAPVSWNTIVFQSLNCPRHTKPCEQRCDKKHFPKAKPNQAQLLYCTVHVAVSLPWLGPLSTIPSSQHQHDNCLPGCSKLQLLFNVPCISFARVHACTCKPVCKHHAIVG